MTIGIIEFIAFMFCFFAFGFSWKVGCSFGTAIGDIILEKYID